MTCRTALVLWRGLAFAVLAASVASSGCGYALAGRGSFLPEYIRTVGIPLFVNNTAVFDPVRLTRHRLDFGVQLRFQMVKFGAHFLTDLVSPEDANQGSDYETDTLDPTDGNAKFNQFGDDPTNPNDSAVKRQWTLAFDLGAVF